MEPHSWHLPYQQPNAPSTVVLISIDARAKASFLTMTWQEIRFFCVGGIFVSFVFLNYYYCISKSNYIQTHLMLYVLTRQTFVIVHLFISPFSCRWNWCSTYRGCKWFGFVFHDNNMKFRRPWFLNCKINCPLMNATVSVSLWRCWCFQFIACFDTEWFIKCAESVSNLKNFQPALEFQVQKHKMNNTKKKSNIFIRSSCSLLKCVKCSVYKSN